MDPARNIYVHRRLKRGIMFNLRKVLQCLFFNILPLSSGYPEDHLFFNLSSQLINSTSTSATPNKQNEIVRDLKRRKKHKNRMKVNDSHLNDEHLFLEDRPKASNILFDKPPNFRQKRYSFIKNNQGRPSPIPSVPPTRLPSLHPTEYPSQKPTNIPSSQPSETPTSSPSALPSNFPSNQPSFVPSSYPSRSPSDVPSQVPSYIPSTLPTFVPSHRPSARPSRSPSAVPSKSPSFVPSTFPSTIPTSFPSYTLTTKIVPMTAFEIQLSPINRMMSLEALETLYSLTDQMIRNNFITVRPYTSFRFQTTLLTQEVTDGKLTLKMRKTALIKFPKLTEFDLSLEPISKFDKVYFDGILKSCYDSKTISKEILELLKNFVGDEVYGVSSLTFARFIVQDVHFARKRLRARSNVGTAVGASAGGIVVFLFVLVAVAKLKQSKNGAKKFLGKTIDMADSCENRILTQLTNETLGSSVNLDSKSTDSNLPFPAYFCNSQYLAKVLHKEIQQMHEEELEVNLYDAVNYSDSTSRSSGDNGSVSSKTHPDIVSL